MPTSSGSLRTYGKKSSIKRKQNDETSVLDTKDSLPSLKPLKRRRLSGEVRTKSPSPSKTDEDGGTDAEDDTPVKVKHSTTYTSRGRKEPLASSSVQKTRAKPVRDLSGVFDNMSTTSTPVGTPSKLAKRMLGRSRTESSVESQISPRETQIDRTSSLPNLPPSPSGFPDVPRLTSRLSGSAAPSNSSKSSTTRTYAGNYRSFLMAVPTDTSSGSVSQVHDEEELEHRESYNILRTRWGVDNSEDDPHPFETLSPTKSMSSTSEASPARKGKSRALQSSRPPPPAQIGSMNYLKSISELRNKGEGRRFLDEVGYLFEGLDAKAGLGLRRATMLEIITKLCDTDFTRKAIATDFFPRTWDLLLNAGVRTSEDKILDLLAVCFLAFLARDPSSLFDLAERPLHSSSSPSTAQDTNTSVLDILTNVLSTITPDSDLLVIGGNSSHLDLSLKPVGLTKKDRTLLVSIHKVMATKSDLFPQSTPLSTPLLIVHALHALPPSLLLLGHSRSIISSLRLCLSPDPSTTLSAILSSQWPDIAGSLPYENLYYHIKLVDTFLSRQRSHSIPSEQSQDSEGGLDTELAEARDLWMAEDLVSLGVCLEHCHRGSDDEYDAFRPESCLVSVLRMLVSLTHADEQWGQKVLGCDFSLLFLLRCIHRAGHGLHPSSSALQSQDGLVQSQGSDEVDASGIPAGSESNALDLLCLALGLLTNLVQVVEELKDSIRTARINPSCSLEEATCLSNCSCSPSMSGIDLLASLYAHLYSQFSSEESDTPADPEVEAESSFLRGHLAVLFGLLMIDNPDNQSAILAALPTISPSGSVVKSTSKRKPAAVAGDNRIKLSRLVDQARDFVVFYTVISRKFGGDGEVDKERESRVAKEVVLFLEGLRDDS